MQIMRRKKKKAHIKLMLEMGKIVQLPSRHLSHQLNMQDNHNRQDTPPD